MPGSRVKTTTRVTSRVNGRMGTKDKVRTSSFYVQPSPAANKGKGVRIVGERVRRKEGKTVA